MKYEEWIRYENKRQKQANPIAWVALEPDLLSRKPPVSPTALPESESNRVWTFIIQVINSSRI